MRSHIYRHHHRRRMGPRTFLRWAQANFPQTSARYGIQRTQLAGDDTPQGPITDSYKTTSSDWLAIVNGLANDILGMRRQVMLDKLNSQRASQGYAPLILDANGNMITQGGTLANVLQGPGPSGFSWTAIGLIALAVVLWARR